MLNPSSKFPSPQARQLSLHLPHPFLSGPRKPVPTGEHSSGCSSESQGKAEAGRSTRLSQDHSHEYLLRC